MASTTTGVIFRENAVGPTTLVFRPGSMSLTGGSLDSNQVVTQCESGRIVVAEVTTNMPMYYEFAVQALQYGQESAGITVDGFYQLRDFIENTVRFRAEYFWLKLSGLADTYPTNYVKVRYWDSSLPWREVAIHKTQATWPIYEGRLILRKEVE